MIRYLAAATTGTLAIALAAVGCGPRDVSVSVSGQGMQYVLDACKATSAESICVLAGNPTTSDVTLTTALQARLVLSDATGTVRASSACFELLPSSMPASDPEAWGEAMATELNQELAGALPGGLTYSGLKDPAEVALTLALYDPTNTTGQCDVHTLIACAGFEQPLSGGDYDISCVSCQRGQSSVGLGVHCPSGGYQCFLEECEHILETIP